MIPIYDDNPTRRLTWVTWTVIALNLGAFAYELSLTSEQLTALISSYGFNAARFFAHPTDPAELMTLVTAAFLHAGWAHLLGNMLYLWIFGNNIEDRLGHWRFALFYVLGGAVASVAQGATDPGSAIPLVGASGAIAGVLGAYVVLFPRARVITIIPIFFFIELAAVPAMFVIGFWFVLQLAQGIGAIGVAVGGVAWWAHVAGFAFGLLVAAPIATRDSIRSRRVRRKRSRDSKTG